MSQGDKRFREEGTASGAISYLSPVELDSAAKKPRMDEQAAASSKVLHVRNLPPDVTEGELTMLGSPFGQVINTLLLKSKNQGFIELTDCTVASRMVNYYVTMPATIRGRNVYVQYSKHQELKMQPSPGASGGAMSLAPPSATGGASPSGNSGSSPLDPASPHGPLGCPNSVLRIIIENMLYPITIDVLHQIFSKYGTILRIVTFYKNTQFHALIQYPDAMIATNAKASLDGQNIYNGCCTLRIDFSKLSNLTVKFNNEKTRDYTRPELPTCESDVVPQPSASGPVMPDISAAIAGISPALLQNPAIANLRAVLEAMARTNPASPHPIASGGVMMPGVVVLISNLNDKMITPHALFILFGVYGDVVRVKILYNKRDSALVQFKEPQHAQTAIANLSGVSLYGKKIHVTHSKHSQVQMPQAGSNEDALTEDHTNSALHRFKKPGSKNYQNIFPPSATLHLSNIPECVDEDFIKRMFTSSGGAVENFRFFQNDHRMALIQMGSTEEAVAALIAMHNYKISETNHLRVSFSKNPIS